MLKRILLPIFLFILIVFVVVETLKISVLIQNKVSKEMISTSVERNMFFNWILDILWGCCKFIKRKKSSLLSKIFIRNSLIFYFRIEILILQ